MKLFFVEIGSPYSFDLANALENNGFDVSHVTTSYRTKDLPPITAKKIESKYLYNSKTLLDKYKEYFHPLTLETLNGFQSIERDFWILTDRANSNPISFRKRKILYCDLIRFWLGYLKKEKIEAIYFPYTPHAPWELVLMQAVKFLGLPYCYLSHTAINNRSILRISYEHLEKVPTDHLKDQTPSQIKKQIPVDLLKDFLDESVVTSVIKLENDAFQKQKGKNADAGQYDSFLKGETKNWVAILKKEIKSLIHSAAAFFGVAEGTFRFAEGMNKRRVLWGWEIDRLKHQYIASKLKAYYASKAGTLDLNEKYIYFPLHLQPELTSQPEAGYFEDQQLALETLLAGLPAGWKVFVKDNPRQFDHTINTVSAIHYRDRFDIDRFLTDDRVRLVPQSIKSEELILNAQALVTLTGTAGWESLNLGKPCMTFGKPWYSPCPSCFVVSSPRDVKKALQDIKNKTKKDVSTDLLKYIHFYQDKLVVATLHAPSDVSYNSKPYDEILAAHTRALQSFFNKKHTTKLKKAG